MNARERFIRCLSFEPVDRLPVVAFEPYEIPGLEGWRKEGMPPDASVEEFFNMDLILKLWLELGPIPKFEQKRIAETEDDYTEIDWLGCTVKRMKEAPSMYYGLLDHPVKTPADWKEFKKRFDRNAPERVSEELEQRCAASIFSEMPVGMDIWPFLFRIGFYSMGMERFMTAFYDEPEMMHDMFAHWSDLTVHLLRQILPKSRIDYVTFGEDLAYKTAPHVSPSIYKEFFIPYMRPVIEELRKNGVKFICMWSAGNFDVLIPDMLDIGINCTWPLERAAGMDPAALRKKYGCNLALGGGFPKEALIAGPAAIDRELDSLHPVIAQGGYIPALDDMVPPEVPLASYRYYVNALKNFQF